MIIAIRRFSATDLPLSMNLDMLTSMFKCVTTLRSSTGQKLV
jgi:hypothetical protein